MHTHLEPNFEQPKLDILYKHDGLKKSIIASSKVVIGDWYYNKEFTRAKNERLYVGRCFKIDMNLMQFNVNIIFF